MSIINRYFDLLYINIVLIVFLIALINIVITMKVNHRARYSTFLVYSAYILCTILSVAAYLTFTWYFAVPVALLMTDLASNWVKKQLVTAAEEELKGGFGLTKKIRIKQIEEFILKASPVELNRVNKFKENPVTFNKAMFMAVCNVMAFLIAVVMLG